MSEPRHISDCITEWLDQYDATTPPPAAATVTAGDNATEDA